MTISSTIRPHNASELAPFQALYPERPVKSDSPLDSIEGKMNLSSIYCMYMMMQVSNRQQSRITKCLDVNDAAIAIDNQAAKVLKAKSDNYTASMIVNCITIIAGAASVVSIALEKAAQIVSSTLSKLQFLNVIRAISSIAKSGSELVSAPFRYFAQSAQAEKKELEGIEKQANFSAAANGEFENHSANAISETRKAYAQQKASMDQAAKRLADHFV